MSDSEEDWFNKDEDEIVKSVQKQKENVSLEPEVEYIKSFSEMNPSYSITSSKQPAYSYKKLQKTASKDPLEAFLEVSASNFIQNCSTTAKVDSLILVVRILGQISQLPFKEFFEGLLCEFFNEKRLLGNISKLTNKLFDRSQTKFWRDNKIDVYEVVSDLFFIFEKAAQIGLPYTLYKSMFQSFRKAVNSNVKDDRLTSLISKISSFEDQIDKHVRNAMNVELQILPTLDDLREENAVLLKPNIVNGKYASVQDYLDTQKRLLKEDFISPLRSAVLSLRDVVRSDEAPDIQVFRNVRIVPNNDLTATKAKMLFVDVFATTKDRLDKAALYKQVEEIKNLICGTLLCFSTTTKFDNLILGIVSNSDLDILNEGYINIEIVSQQNVGRVCGVDLQMLACPVFFEPYQNAFNVLTTYNESNFPMANYIVHANSTTRMPRYLSATPRPAYTYKQNTFNPLQLETYPHSLADEMTESQLLAFKLALTSEFSLIQGPPGTGKTEIASKITTALLSNTTLPIVIIAYTNEALDKFLIKLIPQTDSIVRLGSQSKDKRIEKYNIRNMYNTSNEQHHRRLYYSTKLEYTTKFCELQELQSEFDGTEEGFQKILQAQNDLTIVARKLNCLRMISTYLAVREKRVIALTTTSAAKHHLMFQFLRDTIVIFEEAAEVLESHIISSITQHTQQVILIGDHYQLRPHTSAYKLSQQYNMNISLFERMVYNGINVVCLNIQFRMRKEIADLIRPLIYKDLSDSDSVHDYPNIQGIETNLFVVTHRNPENEMNDREASKFNDYEVVWMCEVAQYLLSQMYTHSDIVLLTMYAKQRDKIYNYICLKHPHLQGIQCSTVDNFQGREANIVLLSLVRSNEVNQIGYLKEQNRICVALSRAKMGLYIIGNMNLLASCSATWKRIKDQLEDRHFIGERLPLPTKEIAR